MKKITHLKDLLTRMKDFPCESFAKRKFPSTAYFICEGCEEVHYLNEFDILEIESNSSYLLKCQGKKYLTGQITGTGFVTSIKPENNSVSVEWYCETNIFKKAFPEFDH